MNTIFVNCTPQPRQDDVPPTLRGRLRPELAGRARDVQESSAETGRRGCVTPGGTFKPLSEIRGGVRPLLELRRRWNLPDGHKDKLRIERATREDVRNAAHNPDSVHPNPVQLAEEKKAAARKAATVVPSYTFHPGDLRFVGVDYTSTGRGTAKDNQRAQRIDTGRRRKRASDGSLQVRKRLPMRGITSMRFVLPGVDGTSDGEERAGKRARLDDCALDDPITEFELSTDFGGSLSTLDAFRRSGA